MRIAVLAILILAAGAAATTAEVLILEASGPQSLDPADETTRRVQFFAYDTNTDALSALPIDGASLHQSQADFGIGGPACELFYGASFRSSVQRLQITTGMPYAEPVLSRDDTLLPSTLRFLSVEDDAVSIVDIAPGVDPSLHVERRDLVNGERGLRIHPGLALGFRDAQVVGDLVLALYYQPEVGTIYGYDVATSSVRFQVDIPDFEPNVLRYLNGTIYVLGYVRENGARDGLVVRAFTEGGAALGDVVAKDTPTAFRLLEASEESIWVRSGDEVVGFDAGSGVEHSRISLPPGFTTFERFRSLSCTPDDTVARFHAGRFTAEVGFETPDGATGEGHVLPTDSQASARLWFFSPDNEEMLLKVLAGCDINGHYWVFFAATTDVGFELTVTDGSSGASASYENEVGMAANAVTDTEAFPCG